MRLAWAPVISGSGGTYEEMVGVDRVRDIEIIGVMEISLVMVMVMVVAIAVAM